MNRPALALLLAVSAVFPLASCATGTGTGTGTGSGSGPKVAGNEIGGAIPMAGLTREQAAEMARAHCSKYGHSARMLAVRPDAGDKAVFECI